MTDDDERVEELRREVGELREERERYREVKLREKREAWDKRERRRRGTGLFLLGSLSFGITMLVVLILWSPLSPISGNDSSGDYGPVAVLAVFAVVVTFAYAETTFDHPVTRYVLPIFVVPLLAVAIWAVSFRPLHEGRDQALAAWDRYAKRLRRSGLGDPFVAGRKGSVYDLCARRAGEDDYCLVVDADRSKAKEIRGSYRMDDEGKAYRCSGRIDCLSPTEEHFLEPGPIEPDR